MNGATLRAIRTRCGYTLNQFAALVDVAGPSLSGWELDARDVYDDVAATAYRVHNDYLTIRDTLLPDQPDGPVFAYRKNDDVPYGYDRCVWNAAAGDYALDEGATLMWIGDEDDEEDAL